jgi:protein SCO1/2
MSSYSRTIRWLVWGFLGAVIAGVLVTYLGQRSVRSELPVYQQISSFALTNQHAQPVTLETLRGQVWIANIIFTRCAGPCAKLTRQMHDVQAAMPATAPLRFISLTADPKFDTPEVLREYATRFQADPTRWFFLTGNKPDVYRLAIDELKLTVIDNEKNRAPDEDLFIHSQKFVVVDAAGHVRAYIEGDEPATVDQLVRTAKALLKETKS